MPKRIEKLTPEQKARLPEWRDRYIAEQLSTEPMDRDRAARAVIGMYAAINLPPPRIVFVSSPLVAALAGCFSLVIWSSRTDSATDSATEAATRAATRSATDSATRAATDSATRAAIDSATDSATRSATWAATWAATRSATDSATKTATDSATWSATDSATEAATRAATRSATDSATRAATDSATRAAIDSATDSATRSATWAATWAATRSATDSATKTATDSATWSATDSATWAATRAKEFPPLARRMLAHCNQWYSYWNGGNQWSCWLSHLTFLRDVAGLDLKQHEVFSHYENAAMAAGGRMMHKEFCIIADRPEILKTIVVDGVHRSHCEDGPSHKWRDGWALYHINGVKLDEQIVMRPETQTLAQIRSEENAEVKRIRAERYGWKRYLEESKATVIDRRRNDIEATREALVRSPDGMTILVASCCSTGRVYSLEVPSEISTCESAQSWLSGGLSSRVINAS